MAEIIVFDLCAQVEELVWEHDIGYIEASIMLAEKLGIEEDNFGSLIKTNQYIKAKIQEEAEQLNFLERENRLEPI
tara:strand:+ start:1109 stop:1336 length:228 start_codon:yes stop_codon:yes gene_type:complete